MFTFSELLGYHIYLKDDKWMNIYDNGTFNNYDVSKTTSEVSEHLYTTSTIRDQEDFKSPLFYLTLSVPWATFVTIWL